MKFRDLAWITAMDELQGDIPDPSSFCPNECAEPKVVTTRGAARDDARGAMMYASPGSAVGSAAFRGSARSGHGGSGSMSC